MTGKNKILRRILETCEQRLDMENKNCAVEQEHKEAMKLYLDTWVVPQLKAVRKCLAGEASARQYEWMIDSNQY